MRHLHTPFQVAADATGSPTTLLVRGEIDVATCDQLERAALDVLRRGRGGLHFDLSEVEFMDSSGVQVLVHLERRARRAGDHAAVRRASPPAARIMDLLGVTPLLTDDAPCRARLSSTPG